jgi:hypothetical protein
MTQRWADVRIWMAAAFMLALAMASVVLLMVGADVHGTDAALQMTGRLSFLLFWPAYVGGAAAVLFGPAFNVVKQQARKFGLAFASAHLVHLGLVGWLCYLGDAPARSTFVVFGIAVFWTYLLALLSVGRLQRALGRHGWWLISNIGLNYIAYTFFLDFIQAPIQANPRYLVGYLPFVILAIGGPVMRLCAWRVPGVWRSA